MTPEDLKNYAVAFQSFLTPISIIIGGIWAFRKYFLQQENYPNIEFSADINFIGEQANWWIVELIGIIENKGKVQHKMKEFRFDLNALFIQDTIDTSENWGGQVNFPHLIAEGSFLPKYSGFFFIDPGIKAKYSYVTRVPNAANFLLFHSWFNYYDARSYSHAAEKSVQVPQSRER
jgi:hypothetical protein